VVAILEIIAHSNNGTPNNSTQRTAVRAAAEPERCNLTGPEGVGFLLKRVNDNGDPIQFNDIRKKLDAESSPCDILTIRKALIESFMEL
jgi:hypothetical protein